MHPCIILLFIFKCTCTALCKAFCLLVGQGLTMFIWLSKKPKLTPPKIATVSVQFFFFNGNIPVAIMEVYLVSGRRTKYLLRRTFLRHLWVCWKDAWSLSQLEEKKNRRCLYTTWGTERTFGTLIVLVQRAKASESPWDRRIWDSCLSWLKRKENYDWTGLKICPKYLFLTQTEKEDSG